VADLDALALAPGSRAEHHLTRWVEDLTGPATDVEDISAGNWRARCFGERPWPPSFRQQERRKFLLRTGKGTYLLKFAGLGPYGEGKLKRAEALRQAGYGPETHGLRHGFLVQRWLDGAMPGLPSGLAREALLDHLSRYLAFRARNFPAARQGAALSALAEMARINSAEALGAEYGPQFDRWSTELPDLQRRCRPIEIDGRLHDWEWLSAGGRLIKTDALDHHAAHDLVGCQDIAWDIAGAVAEFSLDDAEAEELRAGTARLAEIPIEPALMGFLRPCYLAFQLGLWSMAADSAGDLAETNRCRRAAAAYGGKLQTLLKHI
jgi:hypothetical protein